MHALGYGLRRVQYRTQNGTNFYHPPTLPGKGKPGEPRLSRSGRLLSKGISPIILALRMAFASLRCVFHVSPVWARDWILPISVTNLESSFVFSDSSRGLIPSW